MNQKSTTVPTILLAIAALAAVVATILCVIRFPTDGAAEPTSAFRAQSRLDDVAFAFANQKGVRYSGTVTADNSSSDAGTHTVTVDDLIVTGASSASGTVTYDGHRAEYREIGNNDFAKGPADFWTALFDKMPTKQNIDLDSVADKWSSLNRTLFPHLGIILNPRYIAGHLGNTEADDAPTLGLAVTKGDDVLPDARFWPTSDPSVSESDNTISANKIEVTVDPANSTITHLKGTISSDGAYPITVDLGVSSTTVADVAKVFSDGRDIATDLASAPAPGLRFEMTATPRVRSAGDCMMPNCGFEVTTSAQMAPDSQWPGPGHINFGITVTYALNDGPLGAVGGTCTRVVRADFGQSVQTRCDATNLPYEGAGGTIRAHLEYKYLPFVDFGNSTTGYVGDTETMLRRPYTLARTGSKKPDAARYGQGITGLPSNYALSHNGFLFDGITPGGDYIVTFAPGYAAHVVGSTFDPSWAGIRLLTERARQQAKAADGNKVSWAVAEPAAVPALTALVAAAGLSDQISVSQIDA